MIETRLSSVIAMLTVLGAASCNEKLEVLHSSPALAAPGAAAPLVAAAVCDAPMPAESVDRPTGVVGRGTPESCTEQALSDAVAVGGVIVFRCGPSPATITVSSEKLVLRDTVIDGAGLVTLSGGDRSRILHLRGDDPPGGPKLTLQNLALERGLAPLTANDLQSSKKAGH
jgi:hypothetical protein